MTIVDILRERLVGKKILVYEFDFKLNENADIQKRYHINKDLGMLSCRNDKRMTYSGEVYKVITNVTGDSYPYEGDSIQIYFDNQTKNQIMYVTVIDDFVIKE
jgi:hypothetical protein